MDLYSNKSTEFQKIIAFLVIVIFFGVLCKAIILEPNMFFVYGGDGMKNYFTFMHHIKNDSTYFAFEGMNYPFGENIVFTDNQPLLSNITKMSAQVFPSLLCNLPAIHNLAIVLGFILGTFGFYLCLRKMDISFVFAILVTLGLMAMHPQKDRMGAHFAMAYPILPWVFYAWICIWQGGNKIKWSILISLIITASGLLHMYFFITGGIMVMLSMFFLLLENMTWLNAKSISKMLAIQVVIPFVILTFITSYFLHIEDRPSSPYGFFSYHSYIEGLIFSYKMPFYNFINTNVVHVKQIDFEGKAYIGLAAILFLIFGLFRLLTSYRSVVRFFKTRSVERMLLWIFICSALISFGLPFTIKGLDGLLDYTGPFKQFRSIGRVAWISFYAINLLTISVLHQWLKNMDLGLKRNMLYFVIPTMILLEGIFYFRTTEITQTRHEAYYCGFDKQQYNIDFTMYQALLPDPYFSVGSECFSWPDQGQNINQNFELAYNFNIPTMGVNMSRTSLSQSIILNELTCQPYRVPAIIELLKQKDQRPLLVVETKNEIYEQRAKLTHWTKDATIVYEDDKMRLRSLPLDAFDTIVKNFNAELVNALPVLTLKVEKHKGERGWGYEGYIKADSLEKGNYHISYEIDICGQACVSSITEIWQFDDVHGQLEYVGEANRFNYKSLSANKMRIDIPFVLKDLTSKLIFRVSIEKMKSSQNLEISPISIYKD